MVKACSVLWNEATEYLGGAGCVLGFVEPLPRHLLMDAAVIANSQSLFLKQLLYREQGGPLPMVSRIIPQAWMR